MNNIIEVTSTTRGRIFDAVVKADEMMTRVTGEDKTIVKEMRDLLMDIARGKQI